MKRMSIPRFVDEALVLSTQNQKTIPFPIKRVFVILKSEPDSIRGRHAHKKTKQALFCIQGAVTVILDNGKRKTTVRLNKPHLGIFIDRMIWTEMRSFSRDAILLVFASTYFDQHDYIRDYETFKKRTV